MKLYILIFTSILIQVQEVVNHLLIGKCIQCEMGHTVPFFHVLRHDNIYFEYANEQLEFIHVIVCGVNFTAVLKYLFIHFLLIPALCSGPTSVSRRRAVNCLLKCYSHLT